MSETMLADQIEMLRVQIENALPPPLLLVVSSARDDDGKHVVAAELASSMEQAGYSTLLVSADAPQRNADVAFETTLDEILALGIQRYLIRGSRASANQISLPCSKIQQRISRETVKRFAQMCRTAYQVTIVEPAALLTNSFAMLAALAADGVLLTVREGRRVCAQDRQLAKALAREQAPFLGVVSISASILRNEPGTAPKPSLQAKPTIATVKGETSREGQAI